MMDIYILSSHSLPIPHIKIPWFIPNFRRNFHVMLGIPFFPIEISTSRCRKPQRPLACRDSWPSRGPARGERFGKMQR